MAVITPYISQLLISLAKIPERSNLEGKKIYFGLQFGGTQSKIRQPEDDEEMITWGARKQGKVGQTQLK